MILNTSFNYLKVIVDTEAETRKRDPQARNGGEEIISIELVC